MWALGFTNVDVRPYSRVLPFLYYAFQRCSIQSEPATVETYNSLDIGNSRIGHPKRYHTEMEWIHIYYIHSRASHYKGIWRENECRLQ
jgi:hypothetical protein